MKSVPISKIDALIASIANRRIQTVTNAGKTIMTRTWDDCLEVVIETLEGIKKESEEMIPIANMANANDVNVGCNTAMDDMANAKEKMIPLSQLEKIIDEARYAEDIEADLCELVNEAKKQPIEKMIPVSVIDARIKELEEIMDIIEPYDHPDFLYEHKERLRDWYIKLKELTKGVEK